MVGFESLEPVGMLECPVSPTVSQLDAGNQCSAVSVSVVEVVGNSQVQTSHLTMSHLYLAGFYSTQ